MPCFDTGRCMIAQVLVKLSQVENKPKNPVVSKLQQRQQQEHSLHSKETTAYALF